MCALALLVVGDQDRRLRCEVHREREAVIYRGVTVRMPTLQLMALHGTRRKKTTLIVAALLRVPYYD